MSTAVVAFNTGRAYTVSGQRIGCAVVDVAGAEWVAFEDVDRHISGAFPRAEFYAGAAVTLAEVMHVYDYGRDWHVTCPIRDAIGLSAYDSLRNEMKAAARALVGGAK